MRKAGTTLLQIVVLGVAYYLAGRLGLLLAIPPGFAATVWPAAGIATGTLLIFGRQAAPGIFIGSFCVNLPNAMDPNAVVISVLVTGCIAFGAMIQAVVGVSLVRRFLGYPNALDKESHVIGFLTLAGPISCVLGASCSVSSMYFLTSLPGSKSFFTWWTWWIGDTIGVLVFAPLMLICFGKPREEWHGRRWSAGVPLVVFSLAVAGTFLVARSWENERMHREFEQQSNNILHQFQKRLSEDLATVQTIANFFASSEKVERHEFAKFVKSAFHHPEIQVFEWIPRVTADQRPSFERTLRADGIAGFPLTEMREGKLVPAGTRPEFFPILYLEPLQGNEWILGFDVASDQGRQETLQRACETGTAAASEPIQLLQGEMGVLFLVPLCHEELHDATAAQKLQNLIGFAAGVLKVDSLFQDLFPDEDMQGLDVRLFDVTETDSGPLLAALSSTGKKLSEEMPDLDKLRAKNIPAWSANFPFSQRSWNLVITGNRDFLAGQRVWEPWTLLAGGLLMTSGLGAFLLILTGRTSRIERLVAERTTELHIALQQIEKSNALLEKSNRDLEQFAYIASHDLQAPLRTLTSCMDVLVEDHSDQLNSDARKWMGFAVNSSNRMRDMIADLLEFARVAGQKGQPTEVDARELCQVVLANLHSTIEESKATIHLGMMPTILADRTRFTQLMQNLIGNALKYRGEQPPVVHVGAEEGGAGWWRFFVRDNGIGIAPEHHERIFAIFERLHGKEKYSGTGIGLAICQRIVEQVGGVLTVQSTPGKGATFYFTWPRVTQENAVTDSSAPIQQVTNGKPVKSQTVDVPTPAKPS